MKDYEHDFPREHFCPPNNKDEKKQAVPEQEMNLVFAEITSSRTARLVGLIIHFVYWSVFGHFNQLPIDSYHKTLIFLTIQKLLNETVAQFNINKQFATFFMPMLVLSIRREIDSVFHTKYPLLFKDSVAGDSAMKNISLLLTKLLDPNVHYSRFSTLESGDNAISMKLKQYFSSKTTKVRDLIYTNSALVSAMLPHKSEGKVRARFMGTQTAHMSRKTRTFSISPEKAVETQLPPIVQNEASKNNDSKTRILLYDLINKKWRIKHWKWQIIFKCAMSPLRELMIICQNGKWNLFLKFLILNNISSRLIFIICIL